MTTIEMRPIGVVRGGRVQPEDDSWASETCRIELDGSRFTAESLAGLDAFSHVEVLFHFHLIDEHDVVLTARHPRGRTEWPRVGIFAQRGRVRPNRLGVSVAEIVSIAELTLTVRGLDAIDGTPVLDLKPVMSGFLPRGSVGEPTWALEIMDAYW